MTLRRIAAVASPVAFVLLARRAASGTVSVKEEQVFRLVNRPRPALRWPVWAVMQAGSFAAIPITAALALRKDRDAALALAIDGTAVRALCKLIKPARTWLDTL